MPRAFLVKKTGVSPGKRNWSEVSDHERGDVYIPGESQPSCLTGVEYNGKPTPLLPPPGPPRGGEGDRCSLPYKVVLNTSVGFGIGRSFGLWPRSDARNF